jgi:hypothetical protein
LALFKAKERFMAKSVKQFLRDLATDAEKLGKFIKNPEKLMNQAGIDKKHRIHIRNSVALEVCKKLARTAEAYATAVW